MKPVRLKLAFQLIAGFSLSLVLGGCHRDAYLVVEVGLQNSIVNPENGQPETFGVALHSLTVTTSDQHGGYTGPTTIPKSPNNESLSASAVTAGGKTLISFLVTAPLGSVVTVTVNGLDSSGFLLGSGVGESAPLSGNQSLEIDLLKHCNTSLDCSPDPFCPGQVTCTGNVCVVPTSCSFSCSSGELLCGGDDGGIDAGPLTCVALASDSNNCGGCGNVCVAGQTCMNGVCGCNASAPLLCAQGDGGACVDVSTDVHNCGGCGQVCVTGQVCKSGGCLCTDPTPLLCGSLCVDPTSDPGNCGACGHDCLGGTCVAGVCGVAVLAAGPSVPSSLSLDNNQLFWINNGTNGIPNFDAGAAETVFGDIVALDLDGGASPQVLVSGESNLVALTADGGAIYWVSNTQMADDGKLKVVGYLKSIPEVGGAELTLHRDSAAPILVAMDSNYVYWSEVICNKCQGFFETTLTGLELGTEDTVSFSQWLSGGDPPSLLTTAPGFVYLMSSMPGELNLSDSPTLQRFNVANQAVDGQWSLPATDYGNQSAIALAMTVAGPNVYAAFLPDILVKGYQAGLFPSIPVPAIYETTGRSDGGLFKPVQNATAGSLADDGTYLYWADVDAGMLLRSNFTGGPPQILADGLKNPTDLTMDATSVYWIEGVDGGRVMRIAR